MILAVICLLTACSSTSRRGGASLGDAAEASAKKSEDKAEEPNRRREDAREERTRERTDDDEPLQIGEEVDDNTPGAVELAIGAAALTDEGSSPSSEEALPEEEQSTRRWHITPSFSFLGVAGDAYEMRWGAGLEFGAYQSNRVRIDIGFQHAELAFLDSQDRIRGLENPSEFQGDVRVLFYATKAHTFASAYAVLGIKGGIFTWEFVEPVDVVENGEVRSVSDDLMFTVTPYFGFGIAPIQWGKFHLGASFTVGLRILQENTMEGFHNDLFPDVGTWGLRLDASYFF